MRIMTSIVAGLFLSMVVGSVALADTVDIRVGAKNVAGDKLNVDVSGPDVNDLTGMARLKCGAGDQCLVLLTSSSTDTHPYECIILLHGPGGSTYVAIDICGGTDPTSNSRPTVSVNEEFGDDLQECPDPSCDRSQFVSVRDRLNLVIKGK